MSNDMGFPLNKHQLIDYKLTYKSTLLPLVTNSKLSTQGGDLHGDLVQCMKCGLFCV